MSTKKPICEWVGDRVITLTTIRFINYKLWFICIKFVGCKPPAYIWIYPEGFPSRNIVCVTISSSSYRCAKITSIRCFVKDKQLIFLIFFRIPGSMLSVSGHSMDDIFFIQSISIFEATFQCLVLLKYFEIKTSYRPYSTVCWIMYYFLS